MRKLTRSTTNRMIGGVCAGIADFYGLDPTVVRVAYALLSFFSAAFPGILLYIILCIIIPQDTLYIQ